MQGYSTPGLLYDEGFFSRSELNFNENGPGPTISSGILGFSDPLDRLDTASSFGSQLGEMPGPNEPGGSQINNSGHILNHHHGDNSYGFDVDNANNLLLQDILHHQTNVDPRINNGSAMRGGHSRSQGSQANNGVTTQWEESLQDLQSLLALHGQHPQMNAAPMSPEPSNTFGSGGLLRGYPNGKFSGESEFLSLLQFPRMNSSSSLQSGGHGGPVSAFPSNPGFRKGPVNSCNTIPSVVGQTASNTLPYPAPSLASNYFNINPMVGNSTHLLHGLGMKGAQHSSMLRTSSSIIDLDQARDHSCDDSSADRGKFCSSLLFESAKRGGSEGSFLTGKSGSEPHRVINHFATERQRREYLNEKYQTLRSLVPNPSKADRASIVADAIEYVKELKRTVQELQILVQEKRTESSLKEVAQGKRRRMSGDPMDIVDTDGNDIGCSGGVDPGSVGRSFSSKVQQQLMKSPLSADGSHLRSSWLQRTSQSGTHVDVRIVHDEVTIKLTQRRRKGCLLHVMVTLYELQLDLQHANGATIGEHDIYIFNTKIFEGTSTFAGYVATKLIEAVDRM